MKRKLFTSILCTLLVLCLSIFTIGCASGKEDYASLDTEASSDGLLYSKSSDGRLSISVKPSENQASEKTEDTSSERKLIRTFEVYAETKDFDKGVGAIEQFMKEFAGYFESKTLTNSSYRYSYSYSSSVVNRVAYFTVRIPADSADEFINKMKAVFNVTRLEESTKDVTLSYSDTESHLVALRAQETRLIEMMASAETLADLIALDDKLTDVRYQIESYEKTLRGLDNQIEYVSISLTLQEVAELTVSEQTFWEELWEEVSYSLEEFGEGCKDFVIGFAAAQPTLIVLGLIGLAIFLIIRGIVKNAKKKRENKEN